MNKYVIIGSLLIAIIGLFGVYQGLKVIKDQAYRVGRLDAINARQETDIQHLVSVMDDWNQNLSTLMGDAPKILINDNTVTGPAVSGWLSDTKPPRKPSYTPRTP